MTKLLPNGRVTIPAELLRQMNFKPGGQVKLTLKDGMIHVEPLANQVPRTELVD